MKLALSLTSVALALAAMALFLAPAASAIVPCEFCPFEPSYSDRCFGTCNGQIFRYCIDWQNAGCPSEPFALSSHPLDTLFPEPFFLLPEAIPFTPSDAGEVCQPVAAE